MTAAGTERAALKGATVGEPDPALVRDVIERLARALDADDFEAAGALLADGCVYEAGDGAKHGPEAVRSAYAAASAWARRAFDDVRYESAVENVIGPTGTVCFTDYVLKAGGRWHRHRCRQEFTVDGNGRIARIVHREIEGEREALDAYLRECGISR